MSFKQFIINTLDYFKKKQYFVKLKNDIFNQLAKNNVLFNNSGIIGIYQYFEDIQNCHHNSIVTIQKCLRITGKHNDFNEVGESNSHSTCFHMLGIFGIKNFSKEKIIKDIYEFIISIINKDNIYITIHPEDEIFKKIWKKINPNIRIEINKDNFWTAGKNSFCGYCTEIIYCDKSKDVEIWNIVHITHKINEQNKIKLEHHFLDTGGGLERLYMLKHNMLSIYQIPEYQQILQNFKLNTDIKIAFDGLKSIDAICYNNIPISNNKHGYVLKKLIKRTLFMLHKNKIKLTKFIHHSSHILTKYIDVLQLMQREETSFQNCLNKFKQLTKDIKELDAEKIIYLHETHGIQCYLIEFLAKEESIKINCNLTKVCEQISGLDTLNIQNTIINKFEIQFTTTILIYHQDKLKINNFIILNEEKNIIQKKKKIQIDKIYYIIPNICNIYPRMGGQEPDKFKIKNDQKEIIFESLDAYKEEEYIILKVKAISINFTNDLTIEIDTDKRIKSSQNHSLTHIMISIISTIICENILQVSSYIDNYKCKLSFFSYNNFYITKEKLEEIINFQLNKTILRLSINHLGFQYIKNKFKTISIKKYPQYVRTITIYSDDFSINSKEVCAGTHNVNFNKIKINSLISYNNKFIKHIEFYVI